jgi:hypothetical protein
LRRDPCHGSKSPLKFSESLKSEEVAKTGLDLNKNA